MTCSIVICTMDRPGDLICCVKSIMKQTLLPKELIIVDAGVSNNKHALDKLTHNRPLQLLYLKSEASTTKQRNIGVERATGAIILFLDDDTVLENDYIEKMLDIYDAKRDDNIGGVEGTIINDIAPDFIGISIFKGCFFLQRSRWTGKSKVLPSGNFLLIPWPKNVIEVECMAGGCCSYYRDIILRYKFDETLTKYAWKEDQDVAYRVARDYKLYKTPYARLYHNHSAVARNNAREVDYKKIINNYYIFKKNIPQTLKNKSCFYWSLLGLLLSGVARSVGERNLDYMIGRLNGIMELLVILTKSSQEWHKKL